jgi:hypothetical protein
MMYMLQLEGSLVFMSLGFSLYIWMFVLGFNKLE